MPRWPPTPATVRCCRDKTVSLKSSTCILLAALLAQGASAGKLRDFAEKAAGTSSDPKPKPPKPYYYNSAAHAPFGAGTFPSDSGDRSFLGTFYAWLVAAQLETRQGTEGDVVFPEHLPGESTVPYVRVDYNWQQVDSDIDAHDVRAELGYKAFAFHGRTSMYSDSSDDGFEMDINQFYAVLRYGGHRSDFLPGTFEAGLGIGASQIDTNDSGINNESGAAFTIPLKYYPNERFGIEFRPAWYKWMAGRRVGDYDLSVSAGGRYIQARAGYRWMVVAGEMIDGPYAGVTVSY